MRYWWVSQNQTYKNEVPGGFMWSPKKKKNGQKNHFYDNMKEVSKGDIVFSYCDTKIKAIGIVDGIATTYTKPDFGNAGSNWENDGWRVPVVFQELKSQIRPKDHIVEILPYLPEKYSPLKANGDGNLMYLAEISETLAHLLGQFIGAEFSAVVNGTEDELDIIDVVEAELAIAIAGDTGLSDTVKEQIVKIRRGQALFKANVQRNEKKCRITGVDDIRHLRASHIKPWKDCDNTERLNGCNGLLLAPHVDHLFDQGFISFENNGDVIISKKLDTSILAMWGIAEIHNVGAFHPEQQYFLDYHRQHVFKREK